MTGPDAPPPAERSSIRVVVDGVVRTLVDVAPTLTVLEWLREHEQRKGTKEGCAEGDCGACTVVVASVGADGRLRWEPVNACIRFLPMLDGKALFTVESLKGRDGSLHPAQRAMVEAHASQCGFCTPGIVMSLFALHKRDPAPTRAAIDTALAGNLCRCTGYLPIIAAAATMRAHEPLPSGADWLHVGAANADAPPVRAAEAALVAQLQSIRPAGTLVLKGSCRPVAGARGDRVPASDTADLYFSPTDLATLTTLLARHPDARILAGGTDVGLWVTKQHRDLGTLVHVGQVEALRRIEVRDGWLEIGAGASLEDAFSALVAACPALTELHLRFASPPIRHAGTLGGNVANGSPIGDSMPALIALGASVVLRSREGVRELPLEGFYPGYQQTERQPGELVELIRVPLPAPQTRIAAYKVSKRFDQDIASVCGAFAIDLDGADDAHATVRRARIAFGGMAAVPARAPRCEQALTGEPWTEASIERAMRALDADFAPIDDLRASAQYRRTVARNLLRRFFLVTLSPETPSRVIDYAEAAMTGDRR